MSEQLLRLENVGYADDSFQVLKDINWELRSGSLYQIIGANASGKTALLRLIAGTDLWKIPLERTELAFPQPTGRCRLWDYVSSGGTSSFSQFLGCGKYYHCFACERRAARICQPYP